VGGEHTGPCRVSDIAKPNNACISGIDTPYRDVGFSAYHTDEVLHGAGGANCGRTQRRPAVRNHAGANKAWMGGK
jgi:hypothetical protein